LEKSEKENNSLVRHAVHRALGVYGDFDQYVLLGVFSGVQSVRK
jgi:hypothetical protein